MRFFNKFPKVDYRFGSSMMTNRMTDISRYADIIDQVKDDATAYTFYSVVDGERPDIVSSKLYGEPIYDWTFWVLNDGIRDQGWPLSYQDFRDHLSEVLPGQFVTVYGSTAHSSGLRTVQSLTEQFPVGSTVVGTTSSATGTVYMRNLNMGQLFIKDVTGTFTGGETINDTLVGTPLYTATTTGQGLAYQAAHHYQTSTGCWRDIDPTSSTPNPSNYTEVTHEEYLQDELETLSRIKVLKPSLISRFAALYKEAVAR